MFILLVLYLNVLLLSFDSNGALSGGCSTSSKRFDKCMTLPTQEASIAWVFHPHNATLDIAFFGNFISPSGWVGWGINPTSPEMTGARVLIAFPDPNSGQLVLLPYILDPAVKQQKSPLLSRPLDLRVLSSSATLYGDGGGRVATVHDGSAIQIHAMIKLVPNKTKIHFVWNRGLYVQGYSPAIHPTTPNDLSSATTVDVLSGTAAKSGNNRMPLKIVHGALNALSWGLLLPIGAATARYLRPVESVGPTWFYAHAGIQIAGVCLGTVGFSLGIKLGAEAPSPYAAGAHRKLGFAAFCLGWLQTLALLFRPRATHRYRKYWKSYHHLAGYACVVVGVVNCFQGFEVMGEGRSWTKLAYCLCLSTIVGAGIALEVNSWVVFCRKAKEEKMKREEGMFEKETRWSGRG